MPDVKAFLEFVTESLYKNEPDERIVAIGWPRDSQNTIADIDLSTSLKEWRYYAVQVRNQEEQIRVLHEALGMAIHTATNFGRDHPAISDMLSMPVRVYRAALPESQTAVPEQPEDSSITIPVSKTMKVKLGEVKKAEFEGTEQPEEIPAVCAKNCKGCEDGYPVAQGCWSAPSRPTREQVRETLALLWNTAAVDGLYGPSRAKHVESALDEICGEETR